TAVAADDLILVVAGHLQEGRIGEQDRLVAPARVGDHHRQLGAGKGHRDGPLRGRVGPGAASAATGLLQECHAALHAGSLGPLGRNVARRLWFLARPAQAGPGSAGGRMVTPRREVWQERAVPSSRPNPPRWLRRPVWPVLAAGGAGGLALAALAAADWADARAALTAIALVLSFTALLTAAVAARRDDGPVNALLATAPAQRATLPWLRLLDA